MLTNKIHNLPFFHHGWCFGRKSYHICQFEENSFFKDLGTGTFNSLIRLIDLLDWLIDQLIEWSDWLIDWLTVLWLIDWLIDWLISWLNWIELIDWLIDWLILFMSLKLDRSISFYFVPIDSFINKLFHLNRFGLFSVYCPTYIYIFHKYHKLWYY